MIPITIFEGKKIALFGLGDSGLATARALMAGGAQVIAFDDDADACQRAQTANITVADLHNIAWQEINALILTPGVPLTHPKPHWAAKLALEAHVEIIGDIELFVRERAATMTRLGLREEDCPLIAITGTNGKSTTTALITHILREQGYEVAMGGNIGEPILQLEPPRPRIFYVIECSSYQIDLAPSLKPTVGILLNLTPDHIDRHGTFEHYAQVKQRLVTASHTAIIALDDASTRGIAQHLKKELNCVISISSQPVQKADWFAKGTALYRQNQDTTELVATLDGIASLRGKHNAQNALAALAAVAALSVDMSRIGTALTTFTGLAHRMEEVGRQAHVLYINDSKATNAEACAPALASFEAIYWIAGGIAKQGGIETLTPFFSKICHAYLIGAAAEDFRQTIGTAIPVTMSGTLAQAVQQASRDALADKSGGEIAIVFSPACASFDQFANYAVRGEAFRQLVEKILEKGQTSCSYQA